MGTGTVHQVAYKAEDTAEQEQWRDHLTAQNLYVTGIIDRKYFRSINFREPGGVLVKIAMMGPEFTVDQDEDELGTELALPEWLENERKEIESREVALFVLEGSGTVRSTSTPRRLNEHEAAYFSPGEWHGFENNTDESVRLVTVLGGASSPEHAGYDRYDPEAHDPWTNATRTFTAPRDITTSRYGGLPKAHGLRAAGNYWYVTADTVGSQDLLLSITRFEAGGGHYGLHRHHSGEAFFYVFSGGGTHVTADEKTPLGPGEMVYTPLQEEHGWGNDQDESTLVLFGWFGASSPEDSGYEQTVLTTEDDRLTADSESEGNR